MIKFNRSDFVLVSQQSVSSKPDAAITFGTFFFKSTEQFHIAESSNRACILVGQVFSSLQPSHTLSEICGNLSNANSKADLIKKMHHLTGRFVVVFTIGKETYVLGDAMGQLEVYFSDDCSVIASSLDLIASFIDLRKHVDGWEELYSRIAETTRIQIGQTTKYPGVQHLMPNHLINLKRETQERFYPAKEDFNSKLSLEKGAQVLAEEMRLFAQSIEKIPNLAMPTTGGHDSRILIGAFKGVKLKTFVFQHPDSDRAKGDISLAKRVLKNQSRALEVICYKKEIDREGKKFFSNPASSPRDESKTYIWNAYHTSLRDHVILFGHGGEIGRSFFKNIRNVNAKMLAALLGYSGNELVESEMQKWLDELPPFVLKNENLMDLFYWEQRMGNWGARIVTEISYVTDIVSPMNARSILEAMLRVPKKHRQFAGNDLAIKLISHLDRSLLNIPLNPSFKYRIIKMMIRIRIYDLYQNIRLRLIANRS